MLTCRRSVPGACSISPESDTIGTTLAMAGRASIITRLDSEAATSLPSGSLPASMSSRSRFTSGDSAVMRRRIARRVGAGAVDHRVDRLVLLIQHIGAVVTEIVVQPDAEIEVEPFEVEIAPRAG